MNDPFERRIRAAAVAGWWTLLIAVVFLSVVWFALLGLMSSPPGWINSLWGGFSRNQNLIGQSLAGRRLEAVFVVLGDGHDLAHALGPAVAKIGRRHVTGPPK